MPRRARPPKKKRSKLGWGGRREGAGRKPGKGRRNVAHRSREAFSKPSQLHVTLRLAPHVWSLSNRRVRAVLERALEQGQGRFETRFVELGLSGDEIHFLVESPDETSLAKAMKGLSVRLGVHLNRLMGRKGRVMGDRYRARRLARPAEVRELTTLIRGMET